jgi:hypothetical protein
LTSQKSHEKDFISKKGKHLEEKEKIRNRKLFKVFLWLRFDAENWWDLEKEISFVNKTNK